VGVTKDHSMKLHHIFILLIFIIVSTLSGNAQPAETTYSGSVIKSGYGVAESYGPYNIEFNFTFYGNTYSQFYVNSSGQVLFGSGSIDGTEVPIPNAALPNNYIAPLWDQLTVSSSGKILYTTVGAAPNRKLIIQGTNMGFYPSPIFMGTYLVILYETSNKIQVQYRIIVDATDTRAHGASATIGIENSDGTDGVQYAYHNPSAISTGQAISFTPTSPSTYAINSNDIYDGVVLTTNITQPEPGIPLLNSPPQNAVIGSDYTFQWSESGNSASYTLLISKFSDMGGATSYPAGTNLFYNVTGLTLATTYYWGVFATNSTGTTWCEIKRFTTSSTPPLAAVPQTIYVEQNQEKSIKLNYTGGDAGAKTAIITALPTLGKLYQYNAGIKGALISSVPIAVTDADRNVIYLANGTSGNGVGNFSYKMNDGTGDSPTALIIVNVSPPGIPNLLYVAKSTTIEMQFDRPISDPTGKQGEFTATVNGSTVAVSALSLKAGDNNSIIATLSTPLAGGETVLISYTAGTVASVEGGWLASFADQPATLLAQTITFAQPLSKKYSDSPFTLTTAAPGGTMTYSSSNLAVTTVSGNVATFFSLGSSNITARQSGNGTYAPAKYVRTLTVAIGDQIITFGSLPPKMIGDADFSPGATSSSGLTVSYSSGNSAVTTIVSGMIHIVGGGTSVITASQAGNTLYNSAASVQQALTVTGSGKTLNLTVFLEGLYNGANGLVKTQGCFDGETPFDMFPGAISDTLSIQLAQDFAPYLIVYSAHGVPINTDGTIFLNSIPSTLSGNYHIIIKHRNHIETWSKSVSFSTSVVNYNFTNAISQAWANNMVSVGSIYCIYTGDTNKDQYVDGFDLAIVFNLNRSGSFGYQISDINGDGFIDGFDLAKVFNNNKKGVGMNTPAAPLE